MVTNGAYYTSSCPSVCLSAYISMAPIGRTSVKFDNGGFYKNSSRKSKCALNRTEVSKVVHEEPSTF